MPTAAPLRVAAVAFALLLLASPGCSRLEQAPAPSTSYDRLPASIRSDTADTDLVLSAINSYVEDDLGQPVAIVGESTVLDGEFASVQGRPVRPDGGQIDFAATAKYARAHESEAFDPVMIALLKRTAGEWRVIEYELGATDFAGNEWIRKHSAPEDIFGTD